MTFIAPNIDSTHLANVALAQGELVTLNSSNKWIKTAAKGQDADGVVYEKCASGAVAQVALLSGTVQALVLLGGTVTAGDEITPSASGGGLKSNTDQEGVVGQALVSGVSGELVPVKIRPKRQVKGRKLVYQLGLASIADGTAISVVPGFRFRVTATRYIPSTKSSTASKLTTLTPKNGTTELTGATPGGQIALTTALTNALGTNVAGATITDDSTALFSATDTLNWIASATTAFVEGAGSIEMDLA